MMSEAASEGGRATDLREMRIRIGAGYLVKLHSLKVLRGRSISTSVEEALDAYFLQLDQKAKATTPS